MPNRRSAVNPGRQAKPPTGIVDRCSAREHVSDGATQSSQCGRDEGGGVLEIVAGDGQKVRHCTRATGNLRLEGEKLVEVVAAGSPIAERR